MMKFKQSWVISVTCFALLFATLSPSVAALIAKEISANLIAEICSVSAVKFKSSQSNLADQDLPLSKGDHHKHCPYCSPSGWQPVLLSGVEFVFPLSILFEKIPHLFLQTIRQLHVWAASQPRAPPLF